MSAGLQGWVDADRWRSMGILEQVQGGRGGARVWGGGRELRVRPGARVVEQAEPY